MNLGLGISLAARVVGVGVQIGATFSPQSQEITVRITPAISPLFANEEIEVRING